MKNSSHLSTSKQNIVSKSFFYKSRSFRYTILECGINSKSLVVIWSHISHFSTFRTKHQMKKIYFKRCSVGMLFDMIMSHKMWKSSGHLWHCYIYQIIAICYSLSVPCYLWRAKCYLLSEYFHLKLDITCKNLFFSLVVVRLVIFLIDV